MANSKARKGEKLTSHKLTTNDIVMTAMFMGVIMVMTFIIRIPVPATQGYIHLGDAMIFMAVLALGWKKGAVAAGMGSAMADLLGGYVMYAPVTLVVKALMAAAVGIFIDKAMKSDISKVGAKVVIAIGMICGGLVMVAGYYAAESVMYGNILTPLAAIPMNILQFVVGSVIAAVLSAALSKTKVGGAFAYHIGH